MSINKDRHILCDTHSHLYDSAFDKDRDLVVNRAINWGVEQIFLPAIDSNTHDALFAMCREYPENCFPMMGLHPTSINDNPRWKEELRLVEQLLLEPPVERFYAVGEVGLDLHWSQDYLKEQVEAFEFQIELSLRHDLPLVIHTRTAWSQMQEVLGQYSTQGVRGVLHSYSGGLEDYLSIRQMGDFMIGISGVVTYRNTDLRELLRHVPLSDIVLETDAPYLTPVPHRGKRNESGFVTYICDQVAQIYGLSSGEVAEVTTANARRLFGY